MPTNTFSDEDAGDTLALSATLLDGSALPGWLSFDANSQTFSGTPDNDEVGILSIKVTATDNDGLIVADTFALAVSNSNDAPEVANSLVDQSTNEDSAFNFVLPANTFTDIDVGDALALSASLADGSVLPGWLSFDAMTQTFSGTPDNGGVGIVSIKVTAIDNAGESVSDQFDIDVQAISAGNTAPVAAGLLDDMTLLKGDNFSFTLADNLFSDADAGDSMSYSLLKADGSSLPDWISFDPQRLLLSGNMPDSAASYDDFLLVATDQGGLTAAVPFKLSYRQPESSSSVRSYNFWGRGLLWGSSQAEALIGQSGNDFMFGGAGDDALYGMAGNDFLFAGQGDDQLKGGAGNDRLYGGSGDDLYRFNPGGGRDTISDYSGDDELAFGAGIDKEGLWFSRSGYDLLVDLVGNDDHVAVKNWYRGDRYQIEEITTSAGDVLHNNQVDQLVQAMAAFSPPVSGILNLSPEEQSQLEPVIASAWQ